MRYKRNNTHPCTNEPIPKWCRTQDDINLHMLYRHERETPKKRGIELLKDNRMCKVYRIPFFFFFYFHRQHS